MTVQMSRVGVSLLLLFGLLVGLTQTAFASQPSGAASSPARVLVIHSYDTEFQWTRDQGRGIPEGLRRTGFVIGRNLELQTFYMETRVTYTTPEQVDQRVTMALELIERFAPDLVFVTDDLALERVAVAYTLRNPERRLPFIFSGINVDPSIYAPIQSLDRPGGPITGALERLPYLESFSLAREIVPTASTIAILADPSPSSRFVHDRFGVEYLDVVSNSPLQVVEFIQVATFQEWQAKVAEYQSKVDVLGVLNYHRLTDEQGAIVPAQEVADWTVRNNRLPELGLLATAAEDGLMSGVGNAGVKHGMYVGILAGEVLLGQDSGSMPIIDPAFVEYTFNIDRARMLGQTIPFPLLVGAADVSQLPERLLRSVPGPIVPPQGSAAGVSTVK